MAAPPSAPKHLSPKINPHVVVTGAFGALPVSADKGQLQAEGEGHAGTATALLLVTALAVVLRVVALDSTFWIDEIATLNTMRNVPLWDVLMNYTGGVNNHLLNTVLVRMTIRVFGEQEWSARLPAVLFGIAIVPALYWLGRSGSRPMLSRRSATLVALLAAASYHLIWFSQNARGYTSYLFFSLLATGALARSLAGGGRRWCGLFVVATVLNLASLIVASFLFVAQLIVTAVAYARSRSARNRITLSVPAAVATFSAAGLLSAVVYAPIFYKVVAGVNKLYGRPASGFKPLSLDFLAEMFRGISLGFAGLLFAGALPFLILGIIGFIRLVRRNWIVPVSLALSQLLLGMVIVSRSWTISPRFLVLALPLAILVFVEGCDALAAATAGAFRRYVVARGHGTRTAREIVNVQGLTQRLAGVFVLLAVAGSLASLPHYYRTPKMPYVAAIYALDQIARPTDLIVAAYMVAPGFKYYLPKVSGVRRHAFTSTRSREGLDSIVAANPGRRVLVATTLPRLFSVEQPTLYARIRSGWTRVQVLPATLGDGEITLWAPVGDSLADGRPPNTPNNH